MAVSYTHLDVYKRQRKDSPKEPVLRRLTTGGVRGSLQRPLSFSPMVSSTQGRHDSQQPLSSRKANRSRSVDLAPPPAGAA